MRLYAYSLPRKAAISKRGEAFESQISERVVLLSNGYVCRFYVSSKRHDLPTSTGFCDFRPSRFCINGRAMLLFRMRLILVIVFLLVGCEPGQNGLDDPSPATANLPLEEQPLRIVNASPQECYDRLTEAMKTRDLYTMFGCYVREERDALAGTYAYLVERHIRLHTDKEELAVQLLRKHGLDKMNIASVVGPLDDPASEERMRLTASIGRKIKDQWQFMQEVTTLFKRTEPGAQSRPNPSDTFTKSVLSDIRINGNRASGTLANPVSKTRTILYFVRENGSWVTTTTPDG